MLGCIHCTHQHMINKLEVAEAGECEAGNGTSNLKTFGWWSHLCQTHIANAPQRSLQLHGWSEGSAHAYGNITPKSNWISQEIELQMRNPGIWNDWCQSGTRRR